MTPTRITPHTELGTLFERIGTTLMRELRDQCVETIQVETDTISFEDIRSEHKLERVVFGLKEQLVDRIREAGAVPDQSWFVERSDKADPFYNSGKFVVSCLKAKGKREADPETPIS